jgi:hypothetical protein
MMMHDLLQESQRRLLPMMHNLLNDADCDLP